ncbi:hypothetical protein SCP_0305540 [Sparassis crispa]|uniref:F-box domain-containing protein n=1 Tax=Sparassis crispa TaxID=139825 RepID=A0A401GF61_9APHY|nr:hypothetical protein SCP_0305540 [Sparassis crispa]GBE80834.1 hypothetical protein SCP_0305540 [Sparassis crispa]
MAATISTDSWDSPPQEHMSLNTLPYDLLLNVAQHLDLRDIYAVQLTCKSLHDFATTRPVFRNLAVDLLRRCRALPLSGFQRLSDLSTDQLIAAVKKATRLETAWSIRAPRPSHSSPYAEETTDSSSTPKWYRVISAPPYEEVDWLSPITSSYSLCATKSGKVVCWDVHRDICLAEWDPNGRWELWKCRVEFDIRTVFFTMAKVLHKTYDDRLMEFVLMKLHFPDSGTENGTDADGDASVAPVFSHLATFRTIGVVMNVFLLDPASRLLSAFVWVSALNTIGLYALLDWDKNEFVFIDTGIECSLSSNWSCILHKEQIVIHSEESDRAYQYFYPISLLQQHVKPSSSAKGFFPTISDRVCPAYTMSAPFVFPSPPPASATTSLSNNGQGHDNTGGPRHPAAASVTPNPFPFPPWYPESAHFVRQWWPTLSAVPRLSCTVVLLADHDPDTHRTRYVLAQHYFKVPLAEPDAHHSLGALTAAVEAGGQLHGRAGSSDSPSGVEVPHSANSGPANNTQGRPRRLEDAMMRIWYVSEPFEVVCVIDGVDEEGDDGAGTVERPRPLMAVDFGHAVWIEFVDTDRKDWGPEPKRLRFVSFPPITSDADEHETLYGKTGGASKEPADGYNTEGAVRTLEIPQELDLDAVETINIDQSQGAVIISVKEGRIFILCYE